MYWGYSDEWNTVLELKEPQSSQNLEALMKGNILQCSKQEKQSCMLRNKESTVGRGQLRSGVNFILKESQGLTQQTRGRKEERKFLRKETSKGKETKKNKMFLQNYHCLVVLLNIKWEVENGNKCHQSKSRVRPGKSKSQRQLIISQFLLKKCSASTWL